MLLFTENAMMKYNSTTINDEFIIYLVKETLAPFQVLYVGCCPVLQFMLLPDLRQNRLFQPGVDYLIQPVSVHPNKNEALNARAKLNAVGRMPLFNKMGYVLKRGQIICDQTDEVFNTVREAAAAHFCACSNLSNHLNHKPGFNSIKGKTYRYKNSC